MNQKERQLAEAAAAPGEQQQKVFLGHLTMINLNQDRIYMGKYSMGSFHQN